MSSETPGWLAALRPYALPQVRAMLALGFSAGLPFLLVFATLSAWLTQAGVSRTAIGMFSWVGITYSIKVFWAPVVDRMPLPLLSRRLGRRRAWMLLAQAGIVCGLLGLAASDPVTNLAGVAWLALLVAFSSATQDIAIDAWRIEAAPAPMQGAMAAAYQLGYRIALLVAGAGALFLAAEYNWPIAYLAMALCVGVGVLTTAVIAEPDTAEAAPLSPRAAWAAAAAGLQPGSAAGTGLGQRLRPLAIALQLGGRWFAGAVVGPFREFFQRNGLQLGAAILLFIGLFRVTDITMGVMANPFYLDLGYSLKQVAAIAKGFGVFMTIAGAIIGGVMVARWGAPRTLILGGLLVIATNLCFALLALWGLPDLAGLALVISADNLSGGIAGTAFIAYLSGLTNAAYTATQYALFSSLFTLPGKLLAGGSGWVVDSFGYPLFFCYTSLLGVPALLLISWLLRQSAVRARSQDTAPAAS